MTEQQTNREEQKKQTERLVHKLITAIDESPDKANNYYDLGSLLTRLQDYAQAEELFMKALGIFEAKGDQEAQNLLNYGLGNLYYEVGKVDQAIKLYNKIDDKKLKADSYLMLAQSYSKKKQYKQVVAYGLTAHELRPEDPEIDQALGDALLALGEFKQAASYYDAILKHHPGRADTQFNRGLVAMVLGEPYKDYLNQARQLDLDYYTKSEKRIAEIEKTLQATQKPQNDK
ncbi:tetratricopeptide repeat protein [Limosilactobacillus vaginalis]|jgi:tetratricopeptide (TPR) repeat protein|uniref:Tetratricopeptide repeat protein n=2 Tax=Limosilactobacillus vaginalis TaxID=1633 RepID=C2ERX1_9LACO|nr:tetratricopeptide repeat protein [Limosilactobacillus vaginalis]EEJ41331.1 tetratricopeptide repeat protein [Limosilactobacillus vaginalis DSM 5837 = ATCC 49540]KRM48560.1 tetratricopeptide TPR 2 repeat protein [Limosilactobacillus vaginalis DSM 5837 = ATCC 49540]MCZ3667961.1 tetratricopeptide repeat protein [Limosilactobacillus vaginalis]MDM8244125.1 tetratricopeptide repeat protein [Limosilactobacillus vaginalis]MDM8264862.1 tetratricopeptide repeat protein [Limosilactobacillus vaginalis]